MKKLQYILSFLFLANLILLKAQTVTPAKAQSSPILISGGTIHVGNGKVLENQLITIENGKITGLYPMQVGRGFPGFKEIDARGKQIYPGFIAANNNLGLVEILAAQATDDITETGVLNPNVRAVVAYNTDSEIPPTVRTVGVLMTQATPQGGLISGSSSVMELDGWNWEDAAYKFDDGLWMNWPPMYSIELGVSKKNENYNKQINAIQDLFDQAKAYYLGVHDTKNLKLEAMKGLFDKSQRLYVRSNFAKSIMETVQFAKKYDLNVAIVGGNDAWMLADLLKSNNIPVILHETHSLPFHPDDAVSQTFSDAKILNDAGVLFCITVDGGWQQRNLPYQAGHAVGFGLPYEAAVAALTLNPAKIMGIDKTIGSIEVGKDATLFISTGDALDMRSNNIELAWIRGKQLDLNNKQKWLYERYKNKYDGK